WYTPLRIAVVGDRRALDLEGWAVERAARGEEPTCGRDPREAVAMEVEEDSRIRWMGERIHDKGRKLKVVAAKVISSLHLNLKKRRTIPTGRRRLKKLAH
ncbi:unnamed protein product, partial [Urochloa humidicola]